MSNELMVASTEHIEILEPEIVSNDKVFVAGRNWSSMDIRRSVTIEGHTIKEILLDALRREFDKTPTEFQESLWLSRCRCKVNGEEIEASKWDSYIPKAGEFVEFLVAPGKGGGGGKNVLNAILSIAVIALAVYVVGPWALQAAAGQFGATLTAVEGVTVYGGAAAQAVAAGTATASFGAQAVAGLAVMGTMAVGTYAVNKICPITVSPQQAASSQGARSSPTYSINGSSNSANPYGYVPLVLGRFRYNGPLGAKSWTKQIGDDQYFNMLVVWGHADMTAKDFRIGETPLSDFKDVEHIFHGASTGNDLKYFSKSYDERSVGASLIYNEPVERVVGECDAISVDIFFPALADVSSGETKGTDVTFTIEYALEDSDKWTYYSNEANVFFAPAQYIDSYTGVDRNDAWCTVDGTWHVWPDDDSRDKGGRPDPYISPYDPHWRFDKDDPASGLDPNNPRPDPDNLQYDENGNLYNNLTCIPLKHYKDKHKHHEYWFRDAWYVNEEASNEIVIGASTTSPVTRSFEWTVPHGRYKVRITRVSEDFESDSVQDDAKWSTSRAIVNKPAFNTPIPICCSELRIRASEQLSGYVSDFNALCTSRFPVYGNIDANGNEISNGVDANGKPIQKALGWIKDEDGDYIYAETQNPADHIRYLLTSRHALINPYTEAKLDEESLANFAEYCISADYHFDLVCDSEAAAWNRMTAVASSGRGAITADNDGKFGVMVDNADKTVTQMFTPRNSWGFSIERSFYTLPHALRISFYDEKDDYKQKEGFVYADGYNKENATDIVEWSMTGKTRWEDNYRMGRYYLASIKLRPVTVTLSTDWEWMMCRRGDVVGVSHDVLLNTFGTARVVALIYRDENNNTFYVTHEEDMPSPDEALPIGVRLDDTVIFSEDAEYGIAVRSKTGTVLTYQVDHVLNAETADLIFTNSIVAAQCPYIGALAAVSTLGNETSKYLVATISVSDNNSAELTLVPWAMPEILEAENSNIPAWEPPIILPTIGRKGSLPTPSIRIIKSDESMLKRSGNSLVVCMGVWWDMPSGIDTVHGRIFVQGKIALASKPEEIIATNMVDSTALNYIEFLDVDESETYVVKIRLIGDGSGYASDWSDIVEHKVIGRTTKPDTPKSLSLNPISSEGMELSWDAVNSLDISHYEISGDGGSLSTINTRSVLPLYDKTGSLSFAVRAVDVLGLKSDKVEASIIVSPPSPPSPVLTTSPTGNVVSWKDCKSTWNIAKYWIRDVYMGKEDELSDPQFSLSPRPLEKTYTFYLEAVDIFGNRSTRTKWSFSIPAIEAPSPVAGVDGEQVVIRWEAVISAFVIDYYEVVTAEGILLGKSKSTEHRFAATASGTQNFRVRAVDIAGNKSPWGECSLVVQPPKAPSVSAALGEDRASVALAWTMPPADLPVVAFDLVRQWDETRPDGVVETHEEDYGRFDVLAHAVPALPVGEHSFMVRAIDTGGNLGPWGSKDFTVRAPGAVTPYDCRAVYNNVMLYFTEPSSTFFKVREYLVEEMDGEYPAVLGTVDALFFSEVRNSAGTYTYGISPVDVAGNVGPRATVAVKVDNPPNLVLQHEWESTFNGSRSLLLLDGEGSMFGPVLVETWEENITRSAAAISANASTLTWKQKTDADQLTWLSPFAGTAVYMETHDVGEIIAAPTIDVTVTQKTLEGDPKMTCRIEVSADGDEWRVVAENSTNVTTENVRFVRLTFSWTGGLVQVQSIFVSLNVKFVEDSGKIKCLAADCLDTNGDFLPEEKFGTRVDFNTNFIDVEDIEAKPVSADTGLNTLVLFPEGAASYPTGFRVTLLDVSGQPVDGEVYWNASGR